MQISATRLIQYLTCSQQYKYNYVQRYRPLYTPAALGFGNAIHTAFTEYIKSVALSTPLDPWEVFSSEWNKRLHSGLLFKSDFSKKDYEKMAKEYCLQLPDFWDNQALIPILDSDNQPVLERKYQFNLTKEIVVTMYIDLALMNENNGNVLILDIKTAKQPHDPMFAKLSQQLSLYQLGFETIKPGGFDTVHYVGFWELLKRKRSFDIDKISAYPARTSSQIAQFKQSCISACKLIEQQIFIQQPGHAFSSPCKLCDYASACCDEDYSDLYQIPKSKKSQYIAA